MTKGYANVLHMLKNPDLAPLRNRADFAALLWDIAESSVQPAVGSEQREGILWYNCDMTLRRPTIVQRSAGRDQWQVPMAAIRRFARQVAERFKPARIVLFGSYAYGRPHRWSDVDILVVMPARNELDKSVQIWNAIDPPFNLDLIVRTPYNLDWRLREGDWFLREVLGEGKVLYEKADGKMGAKSRSRLPRRPPRIRGKATRT